MAQRRLALSVLAAGVLALAGLHPAQGAALGPIGPIGDGELVLWRSQAKGGGAIDFFLRGARPGEEVFFELTDAEERPAIANPFGTVRADVAGQAWFSMPAPKPDGDAVDPTFFVHAYVARADALPEQRIFSNFVLLREEPALYLLVGSEGAGSRVLHFDPRDRRLDELLRLDEGAEAHVAVSEASALVGDARRIVSLDGKSVAVLMPDEVTIDLEVTPDRSAVLAMTRERLAGGRSLLRLRLLEAADLAHELGMLELLRGGSQLVAARLVTGDDSQRVLFVASHDGVIREITLGAEPGRGLTFLPLVQDGEELLDVRVEDDLLVAVTRSPRRRAPSRLIVLDLRTRAAPFERLLEGSALDFELARVQGQVTAFVALTGGRIEIAPLEPGAPSLFRDLAGVTRIRRAPQDDRLFALSETRVATVHAIDLEELAVSPRLELPLFSTRISEFGLLGTAQRSWLYLVETERSGSDVLWCFELDVATNLPIDLLPPARLGGPVRELAAR